MYISQPSFELSGGWGLDAAKHVLQIVVPQTSLDSQVKSLLYPGLLKQNTFSGSVLQTEVQRYLILKFTSDCPI